MLVAVPAWTHHAFSAEFDAAKPVKLHGVVTKMEWANPHSMDAYPGEAARRQAGELDVELARPEPCVRRGWTKASDSSRQSN